MAVAQGLKPTTMQQLARYNVNLDQWEELKQSLYDTVSYAAAGQTQLQFFAIPTGQSSKTLADTNLSNAGLLPTNNLMLVESIEVLFFTNTLAAASVTAANNPSAIGVNAIANHINDAYFFARSGFLQFQVGSKFFLTEAPMQRFPGKTHFEINAALSQAGEVADATQRIAYAERRGRPYLLGDTPLLLIENQNFSVTLNWPVVVAISDAARVVCILDGRFYRRAQ